jgi:hypothetical protein
MDAGAVRPSVRLASGLEGLQCECVAALGQFEGDALHCSSGAMLDGQDDTIVAVAAKIGIRIPPGVELGGSAQGLAGAHGASALSGVVDNHDGNGVATL